MKTPHPILHPLPCWLIDSARSASRSCLDQRPKLLLQTDAHSSGIDNPQNRPANSNMAQNRTGEYDPQRSYPSLETPVPNPGYPGAIEWAMMNRRDFFTTSSNTNTTNNSLWQDPDLSRSSEQQKSSSHTQCGRSFTLWQSQGFRNVCSSPCLFPSLVSSWSGHYQRRRKLGSGFSFPFPFFSYLLIGQSKRVKNES